jgi:DNA repair exonuclease SbcCD ATPase subunit
MKLEQLRITHLPGLSDGLSLQGLDPGLNIITGPNASGKSSLVRALRYLIDPHAGSGEGAVTLQARFRIGDAQLVVTRTGSQVVWQRDGQSVDAPALPETEFVHCYWLSMADLLEEGPTEAAILDQLRRELAGGFDLDAVRQDAVFSVGPRHGYSQERDLREREKHWRAIRQQYDALERQREQLPELEERIRSAEAASQEAADIEAAIALVEARRQRAKADALLSRFPDAMARLNGDEIRRLQSLEDQLTSLRNEHAVSEQALARASQAMVDTGLADNAPSEEAIEACRENLEQAGQCVARLTEQEGALDRARAREQQAVVSLHPKQDYDPDLAPDAVERATRLAEELREKRRRVQDLESDAHVARPDEARIEAERTMARELSRWLRQLEPARFRHLLIGGGVALVSALVATFAGFLGNAYPASALALVAVIGAGWSLWQLRGMRIERQQARQRALEQDLPPPGAWEPGPVAERLKSLEADIAQDQLQLERARENATRQEELRTLRDSVVTLEEKVANLAREVGFDPEVTTESIAWFVHLAAELMQARAQRAEIQNRMERLQDEMQDYLAQVGAVLSRYGLDGEVAPDVATVRSHFQALESRLQRLRDAEREHARRKDETSRLERQIAEAGESVEALYREAGLEPGDRQTLVDYCNQLTAYREARDELRRAEVLEQDRQARLGSESELLTLATSDEEGELNRCLADARDRANELENLRNQRSELKAQLDETGRNRDLEQARLAADQARDRLEDAWHQAMVAEAGQFLLADVAEEHRTEHQPAVLADARDRLARFTHNRYDLVVDESGRIQVRDTVQGLLQQPNHLSTGTRMQLFLAVRLAWTSVQEGGREPLPIFLDEALTTSDPERFNAIAHNLQALADEEGRQVIYLSAEPADVVRWERTLERSVNHLDLLAGRGGEPLERDQYEVATAEPLPEPASRSPEEYAVLLGVPPVQPWFDAGAIHLFHLMRDDLPLLHQLMEHWRTQRLGELELLLHSNAAQQALPDEASARQLRARSRIARVWVDLWGRGRGRPVDRNALENSGVVRDNFIDAVSEQAETLNGDAEALIQALRDRKVARFQQAKADELEEWFRDNGYLVDELPLTREQREQQVLWQAGDVALPGEIHMVISWLESGVAH